MNSQIFDARHRLRCLALLIFSPLFSTPAAAQPSRVSMLDFATGSEYEDYLRVLQVAGIAPLYPWSIRGFSRREVSRLASADSTGPWRLKERLATSRVSGGILRLGAILNTSYPYGANDGPVWAGRGVTTVISGGVAASAGPVSLTLDPIAFRTDNGAFDLIPNGMTGPLAFGNGLFPSGVDLPQRFGSSAYSRVDPGSSSLRFDSRFVTFGLSTATEWIGPATEYPFLLSTNAGGFPHLFVGTGEPLNIWIGKAHARLMWGKLYQSAYSPVTGSTRFSYDTTTGSVIEGGTERLMTSGQLLIVPRGVDGLEIGIARFFHVPNAIDEPTRSFWTKPVKVLFLENELAQGDEGGFDNQLASAFFRWVFPGSGFEFYGERGFEDQLYDLRDLILDLDHEREYMLGFQKVFKRPASRLNALRFELVNYQEPTITRVRGEGGVYVHYVLDQGHTNRGQLLGAAPGAGWAAASTLSWTRYSPASRTAATFRRIVRGQRGNFQTTGIFDPRGSDVIIAAGLERMRYGRWVDLGWHIEGMQDFNRNFAKDAPNLNLQVTARLHPR
jgi:hypothetical protein